MQYWIEEFGRQQAVEGGDVISLWTREAGLSDDEAQRRVSEVLLVATDADRRLAGVCTAYIGRHEPLLADLWDYRTFVAAEHRGSNVAASMAVAARDLLVRRFESGEDRRAIGILYRVESPVLKYGVPQAIWPQTRFVFVGENRHGDHLRVHYFPGANAPEPEAHGSA